MTSNIQTAGKIEQSDHQGRLFGGKWRYLRRRRIIERLLLIAFGSISPAYLF
jgi:hypothetical protein